MSIPILFSLDSAGGKKASVSIMVGDYAQCLMAVEVETDNEAAAMRQFELLLERALELVRKETGKHYARS